MTKPWPADAQAPTRVPAPRAETVLHFPDAPIYATLATQWRLLGRTVPGQLDREWDALTAALMSATNFQLDRHLTG